MQDLRIKSCKISKKKARAGIIHMNKTTIDLYTLENSTISQAWDIHIDTSIRRV